MILQPTLQSRLPEPSGPEARQDCHSDRLQSASQPQLRLTQSTGPFSPYFTCSFEQSSVLPDSATHTASSGEQSTSPLKRIALVTDGQHGKDHYQSKRKKQPKMHGNLQQTSPSVSKPNEQVSIHNSSQHRLRRHKSQHQDHELHQKMPEIPVCSEQSSEAKEQIAIVSHTAGQFTQLTLQLDSMRLMLILDWLLRGLSILSCSVCPRTDAETGDQEHTVTNPTLDSDSAQSL
ncbi:unnamed protein product [Protopolystoma xenopodis]|uniref:Uncharacterized protein n=1 Tax=Protopolystoma xenopodis TaxID=117903 RepID=A0A3S5AWW5_9PLAT|nr:unnamed protein product [Protopolystoma xenopodis]